MAELTSSAKPRPASARNVIAVLGPTNTGKTHLAIERMLGHETGVIGLPLRLLAREVYDKIVARAGASSVALITGEEKIKPENPRYYVCTVEAMPRDLSADFLAVDEIQLAADPERGHVFTERLFTARGQSETLLLGASTMQETIRDLLPGANFISRPRLSKITYAGQKKISRLPRRTAIVAFSANDVYEIAELIRRQRGGAAVVMGALSPRTRNAQVALYQSGDVDYLVATDAIGMGLNLDVDHVAFAGVRKFDGRTHRQLGAGELAQIAGRAGRYMNDGTFGVTGDVEPFAQETIDKLENHNFEPVKVLQWRNTHLDYGSIDALMDSLRVQPDSPRLTRARQADDVIALETLAGDPGIRPLAGGPAAVRRLWDVCQVPDYRKISSSSHAELISSLYKFIMSDAGVIPEDWFASQVAFSDRTDGDIDTLSTRIAHIRTWTFVSHRSEWLEKADYWQGRTREIEDALSDALHEQLTQKFVDKRTSVLMKSLRDSETLSAGIESDGKIMVETHYVGRLDGFRFTPDTASSGVHGKAAYSAAVKILATELTSRADKLVKSNDEMLVLDRNGRILWAKHEIGRIEAGDDPLKPVMVLSCDEHLQPGDKQRVVQKLNEWLTRLLDTRLKPLMELSAAPDVTGLARGIAFRLKENFGILRRDSVSEEIRALDQDARSQLRKYGVRFGAHNIYFPALLKPAPSELLSLLWALKFGAAAGVDPRNMPEGPRQGLTSTIVDPAIPEAFYKSIGFQICGSRAVRIDMLERLADIIRPLVSWRPSETQTEPPAGSTGRGGFKVLPDMMSIMGCSSEELSGVLTSLGFQKERRPVPPKPAAATAGETREAAEAAAGDVAPPEESAAGDTALPAAAEASPAGEAAAGDAPPPAAAGADAALEAAASEEMSVTPEATAAGEGTAVMPEAGAAPENAAGEGTPITPELSTEVTAAGEEVAAALKPAAEGAETAGGSDTAAAVETQSSGAAVSRDSAAPASEPEYEEFWRIKRAKPERRPQRGGDRGARAQHQGQPREREQGQDQRGPRPPRDRREQQPGQREHAARPQPGQAARPQDGQRPERRPRPQHQENRPQSQPQHAARPGKPDDAQNRPPREKFKQKFKSTRPDSRDGPARVVSSSPKGAGGNEDSPFAALLQLKQRLEQQSDPR